MKLKQVSYKKLIKFFQNKGYYVSHCRGSHFFLINPGVGKIIIPKKKLMPKGTLLAILRETGTTKEEYCSFVERKNFKRSRGGNMFDKNGV